MNICTPWQHQFPGKTALAGNRQAQRRLYQKLKGQTMTGLANLAERLTLTMERQL